MVLPEALTAFLCGSIAADGHVGEYIEVIKTSELERAEEVRDVLRDAGLKVRLTKAGRSALGERQAYRVRLMYSGGQWAVLYWSIKKWGMEKWLGHYKMERLEKLIGLGFQQPLTGQVGH
uniref:Homing endonuclease LAGLIDADG domain-containing protein n=1 Tax=viral metagenome TaxID=1070528 RepID=A0A6M3JDG8_9ZZZZ